MLTSDFRELCGVALPYEGRQKYAYGFDLADPIMPEGYEDYLEPVLTLIGAAKAKEGMAYMTVDEKVIEAGDTQRRPKPHVDGCFMPNKNGWGHNEGWLHNCNDVKSGPIGRMAVIVASSVVGCRAWKGIFDAEPKSDGDLSHLTLPEGIMLPSNTGYLLSPDCIHESLPMSERVQRTFLRIALPLSYAY